MPFDQNGFWTNRILDYFPVRADVSDFGRSVFADQNLRWDTFLPEVSKCFDEDCWPLGIDRDHVFLPIKYESRYAYPLVVWLSDREHNPTELLTLMAGISDQNYLAIAIDETAQEEILPFHSPSVSESEPAIESLAERVREHVLDIRRNFHVHSERIYLAGFDSAATTGLELLLQRPEWFAGMLGFGRIRLRGRRSLHRFQDLNGKQVFLGLGLKDRLNSIASIVRMGKLLHSAGLEVTTRLYDTDREATTEMLHDINHWLIDRVCASSVA